MFPRLSFNYCPQGFIVQSEPTSEARIARTVLAQLAYFAHLFFGDFGMWMRHALSIAFWISLRPMPLASYYFFWIRVRVMSLACRYQAYFHRMALIFSRSHVGKIGRAVIMLIAVQMVYVQLRWTDKRLSDQAVNEAVFYPAPTAKRYPQVPTRIGNEFHDVLRKPSIPGEHCANPTKIGDFVEKLISRTRLPNFVLQFFVGERRIDTGHNDSSIPGTLWLELVKRANASLARGHYTIPSLAYFTANNHAKEGR